MINFLEAEKLIKTLNAEYCVDFLEMDRFKFTVTLDNERKYLFIITTTDFEDDTDSDCVYTFFVDRRFLFGNVGVFTNVVDSIKKYLLTIPPTV